MRDARPPQGELAGGNNDRCFPVAQAAMDDTYKEILRKADEHFRTVRASQPRNLSCRLGCTLCCAGLFEIGAADVAMIAEGLRTLDPAVREDVVRRAKAVFEETGHPALREIDEA
ncbi:MAG TPA: hypothetical protein VM534_09240, partial [Thermoanaerobaculia bacterium]|nr:hypothetical protein [Thermoanaerobaculia bacterium]